ncbi:MAG: hypothetical protein K0S68_1049 [Candidatus Saccharibacteria bacterium]|jgi:hypothetical protein|nr:hypothetical protein [Candidatus Saccharibacteria bacterium]
MSKRLLVALLLALATPATALAGDTQPPPEAVVTEAPAETPAATPDPMAGLGPTATNPAAGGSTADSSALQPAGASAPLQSTTQDSTGLTAPNANTLQQQASSDVALKVLAGELGGERTAGDEEEESEPSVLWLVLVALIALAASALAWSESLRHRLFHSLPRRLPRLRRH